MNAPITNFKAPATAFLSNFFAVEVTLDGVKYPSVENAYQAAKTMNKEDRILISKMTASEAKRAGKNVVIRSDWSDVRSTIMINLLRQKFSDPVLREQLLSTGDSSITEGNWWHDQFWGVCNCRNCDPSKGLNILGKLIMAVRREIRKELEDGGKREETVAAPHDNQPL